MADDSKVSVKLLIDTKKNRVLFAEAGKDFVDFLFNLLALPVGTVIRLLTKENMVGCLGILYNSVENLGDTYMQPNLNKDALLKPNAPSCGTKVPLLAQSEDHIPAPKVYICSSGHCRGKSVSNDPKAVCPNNCGNYMSSEANWVGGKVSNEASGSKAGFVKGVVTYMVMDDLEVKPMSTISSITMLNKFNVKDLSALEERMVDITMAEGLNLLKASLQSKMVLTNFLHIMSYVPRDSNFIEHTSSIGQSEHQRIAQIVVDPGLYLGPRGNMFAGDKKRALPQAYRFFTGSPHVILSRKLVEFSILGWDNLPRTLLLYFSNTKLAHKGYFQTLACNSKEFSSTIINSTLQFTAGDYLPGKEPPSPKLSDLKKILVSGTAFAGRFLPNDPVLDLIDSLVLHRKQGMISPGGWCLGRRGRGRDPCQQWGDTNILRPGPAARRFENLLLRLMTNSTFQLDRCT